MKLSSNERFLRTVRAIKIKEKTLTYLYMVLSVGCLYKAVQHADLTGRAGMTLEVMEGHELEIKEEKEKD